MSRKMLRSTLTVFGLLVLALTGSACASHAQDLRMPDLVINQTLSYNSGDVGNYWILKIQVKNRGDAASRACRLSMSYHTGQYTTIFGMQAEKVTLYYTSVPALNPGASTDVYINLYLDPTGHWGSLYVDCDHIVVERNENNNSATHYF